jgi:hypothetical protein
MQIRIVMKLVAAFVLLAGSIWWRPVPPPVSDCCDPPECGALCESDTCPGGVCQIMGGTQCRCYQVP